MCSRASSVASSSTAIRSSHRSPGACASPTVTTQDGLGLFTTTRVDRKMVPFYVVDGTGRVRVLAPSAALCNPPASRSLNRHVERVIEPGMQIRIVGSVILDPAYAVASERGYRDGAVRATLTGSSKYPLLIDVA